MVVKDSFVYNCWNFLSTFQGAAHISISNLKASNVFTSTYSQKFISINPSASAIPNLTLLVENSSFSDMKLTPIFFQSGSNSIVSISTSSFSSTGCPAHLNLTSDVVVVSNCTFENSFQLFFFTQNASYAPNISVASCNFGVAAGLYTNAPISLYSSTFINNTGVEYYSTLDNRAFNVFNVAFLNFNRIAFQALSSSSVHKNRVNIVSSNFTRQSSDVSTIALFFSTVNLIDSNVQGFFFCESSSIFVDGSPSFKPDNRSCASCAFYGETSCPGTRNAGLIVGMVFLAIILTSLLAGAVVYFIRKRGVGGRAGGYEEVN